MTALEALGSVLAPRTGPEASSYRVALGDLPTALAELSREGGWTLEDLFAIDRGPAAVDAPRFEVVYRFARGDAARTLFLGVLVTEAESIPSAAEAWSAADWCEREIHDLFGLRFSGHPALTRILTHRDFRGHPLRKDHVAAGPQPLERPDDLVAALGPWGENPADDGLSEFVPCDFGPLHPLMRGTARMLVKLDGERVARAVFEIGYQHKGVEKLGESCTWDGFAPLAERLLPSSPLTARLAWHHAVEELLGASPPEGALLLRVLGAELERVAAHARAIAATAAGFGETAATVALAAAVPAIPDFLARARLRENDGLGGFRDGPPQDLAEGVRDALSGLVAGLDAARTATVDNGVFRARGRGLGRLSAPAALAAGATGPMLRSAGVGRDRRRDDPRGPWRRVGIRPELAIARGADVLARTELRFAEIRAGLAVIDEVLARRPAGPWRRDDPRLGVSPEDCRRSAAAAMLHTAIVGEGVAAPAGEVATLLEAPQGLFGFHLVSSGGGRPARLRCRGASFFHAACLSQLVEGTALEDLDALFASLDLVSAELDR